MLVRLLHLTTCTLLLWLVSSSTRGSSAFVPPRHNSDAGWSSASRPRRRLRPPLPTTTTTTTSAVCTTIAKAGTSTVLYAVTPIGPFSLFRSPAAIDLDPHMDRLADAASGLAAEIQNGIAEVVLALQAGRGPPDERKLLPLGRTMDEAVECWLTLHTRHRLSRDFQIREYGKLTEAKMARHGETVESMASLMRWKADGMRAMAKGRPPPDPPRDVYERMQKVGAHNPMDNLPSISAMAAAPLILASPFDSARAAAVLESPTVRQELEKLTADHKSLVLFGGRYGDFDPLGKISFINELEKIEERWDIFFARFSLMGLLNQEYIRQCNDFLKATGLNEEEFRTLLKEAHDLMRQEAERERI